jgi:outer membrane protein OmpA-like peptidoglycan-associated protein
MTASEYARRSDVADIADVADVAGGVGGGAAKISSSARYALVVGLLVVGIGDLAAFDFVLLPRYLAGAPRAFSPSPPNPPAAATPRAEALRLPSPVGPPAATPTAQAPALPAPTSPPAAPPTAEAPALLPPASPPAVEARPEPDQPSLAPPLAATTEPADQPETDFPHLLFARNTSWLSPAAREVLAKLAATLAENPSRRVALSGHSDSVGSEDHNRALSIERARRSGRWLEGRGIDPARIEIQGFGSNRPAASDDSPQAQARNRRVEIDLR